MPAKRNPKKSRKPQPTPNVTDLTPLDQEAFAPAVPPLPVDDPAGSAVRPAGPKAGPPVTRGRPTAGGGNQRAVQPRRYAFRRS